MARFVFNKIVTADEIKGLIQEGLGSGFRVEVKKNRIEVIQDASKGCTVLSREEAGRTSVELHGYMPSGGLRGAILLGTVVLLFSIGHSIAGYLAFGIGALPTIMLVLPSQELVRRVVEIFGKVATKA